MNSKTRNRALQRAAAGSWQLKGVAGLCIGATLSFSAAFADDTEVFFGQASGSVNTVPNVMFVLDTSGSMNSKDNGPTSRLQRMRDALHTIIDTSTNVNIGLMRYNGVNGGGAVVYPITPIDEQICANGNCDEVKVTVPIDRSRDDAEMPVSNGDMQLGGNIFSIGRWGDRPQQSSLVFRNLDIPAGANITSAKIEFTAERDGNGPLLVNIQGHGVDDAVKHEKDDYYIRDLPRTNASALWAPEKWEKDNHYYTSDFSSVVQELVDRNGWCGGQNMGFTFSAADDANPGQRDGLTFDNIELQGDGDNNNGRTPATLHVTYNMDNMQAGDGCVTRSAVVRIDESYQDAQELRSNNSIYPTRDELLIPRTSPPSAYRSYNMHTALRFTNVPVPQGADIRSSRIRLHSYGGGYSNTQTRISIHNSNNSSRIRGRKRNISRRNSNGATVDWNLNTFWNAGTEVYTPDLSALVSQVTNRGGWSAGNAMTLIFKPTDNGAGYREFYSYDGSVALAPVLEITYRVNLADLPENLPTYLSAREHLKQLVNDMRATGGTPIVGAYYEAANYMLGKSVVYGTERGQGDSRSAYHRVSHPSSYTGGSVDRPLLCNDSNLNSSRCEDEEIDGSALYNSPIQGTCQTNHIVILSDGAPSNDSTTSRVESLIGSSCDSDTRSSERCGTELAEWLLETEHVPGLARTQNIKTHTIGFNQTSPFLQRIANAGGGQYYQSDSADELVGNFKSILGEVLSVDTSFVAPAATVNQFNRLTHREDIYFALFRPDARPNWQGNLKRYRVADDGTGDVVVLDDNGNPAVDEDSGFFADNAKSWWSSNIDGPAVDQGGAAEQLSLTGPAGYNYRRVYTYTGNYGSIGTNGVTLDQEENIIYFGNQNITESMLGITAADGDAADRADRRNTLLDWAYGADLYDEDSDGILNEHRKNMGDPMHSRPVLLNYAKANGDADTSIFVATNEGYLHAFEPDGGTELYAYMPKELLSNISAFYDNEAEIKHPYGLDGDLSLWHEDDNNNVMVDAGERAILYVGMRRGGNRYYALDVTDRLNPKLMWSIEGGVGDFRELGQSWSKLVPTQMQINGTLRHVLVFGAGYDEGQDPNNLTTTVGSSATQPEDGVGRGIFVIDALTGQRLWAVLASDAITAGSGTVQTHPDLEYSIPSDLRVIDVDFDGAADQIYVGDMGGQVWRFDVTQRHTSGNLFQGGVIARLNGNGMANSRRFYHEPDVALVARDGKRFLSIAIGSGWQATPLNTDVNDRFYLLRSEAIYTAPEGYGINRSNNSTPNYTPITEADLTDVTDDLNPSYDPDGWYLRLSDPGSGEKVLGNALTINNQLIFTTYEPTIVSDSCSPSIGGGYIYVLDVMSGRPTLDLHNNSGDSSTDGGYAATELTEEDRRKQLKHGGIPPEPAALLTSAGPTILVGPEQPIDLDFSNLTQRTYWQDRGEEPYDASTFTTASGGDGSE